MTDVLPSAPWWANAIQSILGRLGYRVVRAAAADPEYRLDIGLDYVLAHYLSNRNGAPFVFVQVGAFDGVSEDPIHRHVREHGWSGVLVEPQPEAYAALKRNYAGCPGLQFVQAAIAREPGTKELWRIADPDAPDMPSWAAALASFSKETLLTHRWRIPDIADRITSEPVECITFTDLLDRAGFDRLDLVQIDAEGYDFEVLRSIDFTTTKPAIIRFESKHLDPRTHMEAIRLVGGHGYRVIVEGEYGADTIAYLQ